jgi:hypothetical protein
MKFRLAEGSGEAFYYLGVEDDGYPKGLEDEDLQKSINTLHHMARALGATVGLVRKIPGTNGRTCALMRVRKESSMPALYVDLRVAGACLVPPAPSFLGNLPGRATPRPVSPPLPYLSGGVLLPDGALVCPPL